MKQLRIYTIYSHSFQCGKNSSSVISYFASHYVMNSKGEAVCVDSCDASKIGEHFKPEYRLELCETITPASRKEQDIKLGMTTQIIWNVDRSCSVVHIVEQKEVA